MPIADRFLETHPELLDQDLWSPEAVHWVSKLTAPLERYYRFRCEGMQRVPSGACLVVANHSIGAVHEILLLLRAWYRHHGHRPARGLTHQVAWQLPLSLLQVQKIGGILAHAEVARRALERGQALLVFPGGDLEACRPFSERYRVHFGGRTGFAGLARASNVPIVPVVFCGSHASYIALPGGKSLVKWTKLDRLFGLKSFPITAGLASIAAAAAASTVMPIALPLFLGATVGAFVPLPSRIDCEVLSPIYPEPDDSDDTLAARVERHMQHAMTRLAEQRKTPWW